MGNKPEEEVVEEGLTRLETAKLAWAIIDSVLRDRALPAGVSLSDSFTVGHYMGELIRNEETRANLEAAAEKYNAEVTTIATYDNEKTTVVKNLFVFAKGASAARIRKYLDRWK